MMQTALLTTAALVLLAAGGCQTTTDPGPSMTVAERLQWSAPPTLAVSGLLPETTYTVEAERVATWSADATERSRTVYTTDDRGRLDTSVQAPVDVATADPTADPYAIITGMDYIEESLPDLAPGLLRLTLSDDTGVTVATTTTAIGPDTSVLVEDALGADFPGAFVLKRQDKTGPQPGLVILGGSEGGDGSARASAPVFAAEGYTVLGLPYYSPAWFGRTATFPDLPRGFAELPIDYLESAVALLRTRADVDADRILLIGGSKGAEYVLLAGSLIPDDSPGGGFCAIVADVPSDVVWEGWGPGTDGDGTSGFSWRGQALPFVPYAGMDRALDRSDPYTMTEAHENGRSANPDSVEEARIRVEDIDEPLLVIGGDRDTTWASGAMSRRIKARRDTAGLSTDAYIYPDGGHGVGGDPLRRSKLAESLARRENFPATLAFLAENATREDCRTAG